MVATSNEAAECASQLSKRVQEVLVAAEGALRPRLRPLL